MFIASSKIVDLIPEVICQVKVREICLTPKSWGLKIPCRKLLKTFHQVPYVVRICMLLFVNKRGFFGFLIFKVTSVLLLHLLWFVFLEAKQAMPFS